MRTAATKSTPAITAWAVLVLLSAITTLLTLIEVSGTWRLAIAAGLLLLAGLKAHVIMTCYLGLGRSRFWTSAFDTAIICFLLIGFGVYLLGSGA